MSDGCSSRPQVTPVYIQEQWPSIDWYRFLCLWERLPADMKHVADVIGIQEGFLAQAVQGRIPERTQAQRQKLEVHRRFLTALALHDLVREAPLSLVAHKYSVSKGLLQNLQSASGTFAGMVTVFCSRLGWKNLELLLGQFQSRLTFGVERELCDLVQISALNGSRARALYNAGFHTLSAVATANPITIESCLRKAFPFQSSKINSGSEAVHTAWCSKLRRGMTEGEQARLIVREAQHLLAEQIGLPETAWNDAGQKQDISGCKVMQQRLKDMLPPPLLPGRNTDQTRVSAKRSSKDRDLKEKGDYEHLEQSNKCTSFDVPMNIPPSHSTPDVHVHVPTLATVVATADKSPRHASLSPPLLPSPPPSQPTKKSYDHPTLSSTSVSSDLSVSLISSQAMAAIDAACTIAQHEGDQRTPGQYPIYTASDELIGMQVAAESPVPRAPCPSNGMPPPPPPMGIKELSDLYNSTQSVSGLTVINVTVNKVLFDTFLSKCLEQTSLSFSVATEPIKSTGIGTINQINETKGISILQANQQVVGVAFCWGGSKVYFISLCDQSTASDREQSDVTACPVGANSSVALSTRLAALRQLLTTPRQIKLTAYDLKGELKLIMAATGVEPAQGALLRDPVVADWLLDSGGKSKSLNQTLLQYLPDQPLLHQGKGESDVPLSSLATLSPSPYLRASARSVLASLLMEKLEVLLQSEELYDSFLSVEMPSQLALAKIELNGIGFSADECDYLRDTLKGHLSQLEQLAHQYAGRTFSLTSPEEVAQVLFVDLQLPSGQEKRPCGKPEVGVRRRGKRIQHLSTAKDVLLKICHLHPLPGVILEWRRVFNTLSKTLFPLFKEAVNYEQLHSVRIHSTCQLHTATGRVSFSDPNLQNIPNEYSIGLEAMADDQDSFLLELGISREIVEKASGVRLVCMRNVFTAFPGGVFLAADYSQLELRILAHMSGDITLKEFLNSDGDAFRLIAGEWLGVSPSEVTVSQRQQTKQLCYGMIYGIGGKALAEQLSVTEEEALGFMETFKGKYPAMQQFITSTLTLCSEKGYIVTLKGRRRYLPDIHSSDVQARRQAERQAVNSTIQGSAADLAKIAMNNIDTQLTKGSSSTFLSHACPHRPVLLVLQLHDELLFEVHESMLQEVAQVVRREMECAMRLTVKLPVKLKTGRSWGSLTPFEL